MGATDVCPACKTSFQIPWIDPAVSGFDQVRRVAQAYSAAPPSSPPPPPPPPHDDAVPPDVPQDAVPPPPRTSGGIPVGIPVPVDSSFADLLRGPTPVAAHNVIDAEVVVPYVGQRQVRRTSASGSITARHPRLTRWLALLGMWFGPTILCLVAASHGGGDGMVALALAWFLWGVYAFRYVMPFIFAILVPRVCCPRCYAYFDLTDLWWCGCGYHDHRNKHFYLFRCRLCKNRLGHFNCPRCQTTILM
jgi:hypothetical protein